MDTECSRGENGVFLAAASIVRGNCGAESSMLRRQPLIVFICGGGCTIGTGTAYVFPCRIRQGLAVENSKINAMVTLNSNADEAMK